MTTSNEIAVASSSSRLRTALERSNTWYAAAVGATELAKSARSRWRDWRTYTVTINDNDPCYQDVQDWLLTKIPVAKRRELAVHTERGRDDYDTPVGVSDREETLTRLDVSYDSGHEQRIEIDGHRVWVQVAKNEFSFEGGSQRRGEPGRIMFRCTNTAAQQHVVEQLRRIVGTRRRADRRPQLLMLSSWGHWQRRSDVPARTVDSVVLREGQMEGLIDDLGQFLDRETDYVRRGIPWHRGYLFQGPPGTGKTSVAKALANQFKLDLWYAPLGDLEKDTSLLALLGEVRPRSVLLLEDIDIYHAATKREAEKNRVSLSGLLNALDGVATPHGLITILTSNEPKALDEALVRPGRIDRVEDIDYVTEEQAQRLFTSFYGHAPRREWAVDADTSAADLTETFKRHMDDPDSAERVLAAQVVSVE